MAGPEAVLLDGAAFLPRHRRPDGRGNLVAEAWHDEDVVTMGAAAALELADRHDVPPAALLLATVSGPFAEGGNAQVLAEVLGLTDDLFVLECTGTVAAGGAALATACSLAPTLAGPVLVVAADRRRDRHGRPLGDAAAAILVDAPERADRHPAARVIPLRSSAGVVRDRWRRDGQATVVTAERSLARAIGRVDDNPDDVDLRVAVSPVSPPLPRVGEAGCATFLLALLRDLDGGDGRAVVTASGVSHRFAFTAGPGAARVAAAARAAMAAGVDEPVPPPPSPEGFDPYASQARSWRERGQDLRLEGQVDPDTGVVYYPPVPAAAAEGLRPHRLARRGRVLTSTRDRIVPLGPPLTMAVVELDGGGRFYGPVVDGCDVAIDDLVTLVLRRLHDGGGLPQWFFKVQPDDGAGTGPAGDDVRDQDR